MTESSPQSLSRRRLLLGSPVAGALGFAAYCCLTRDKHRPSPAALPVVQPPGAISPHVQPRAKNVIFLFMAGGPSQVDLLDPKPELERWAGSPFSAEQTRDLKLAIHTADGSGDARDEAVSAARGKRYRDQRLATEHRDAR
jgi:hypothetical protein